MAITTDRTPYVGAGEDGARRSATIDRSEADGLDIYDDRHDELLASAEQWEDQAYRLMLDRLGPRPDLAAVRARVGNEEWLAAFALLDLSRQVRDDAAQWTEWSKTDGRYTYEGTGDDRVGTFHPAARMDWQAWDADVDKRGRPWSSTEWGLFHLIAALTIPERPLHVVGVLDRLGSWESDALRILVEWASGGNNRDPELAGRCTVIER